MEGQCWWGGSVPSILFHSAELGQDGRASSASRRDSGGGDGDASGGQRTPDRTRSGTRLKGGDASVDSWTMGHVHQARWDVSA